MIEFISYQISKHIHSTECNIAIEKKKKKKNTQLSSIHRCRTENTKYQLNRCKIRDPKSEPLQEENKKYLDVQFTNKGIDPINISHVLHHKEIHLKFQFNFQNQTVPIVSYLH